MRATFTLKHLSKVPVNKKYAVCGTYAMVTSFCVAY